MSLFFLIILCASGVWTVVMYASYLISGWRLWEHRFRRAVTYDNELTTSVSLKKFGSYNRLVRVGVEEYGVTFRPTLFLLFHRSFAVPWVYILSFEYHPWRLSNACTLHTQIGDIVIAGEVAEVIARGCANHFVTQISS